MHLMLVMFDFFHLNRSYQISNHALRKYIIINEIIELVYMRD